MCKSNMIIKHMHTWTYLQWDRRGRMAVGFTTTYAISAYHH